jgi:hypothetical protein
MMILKQRHSRSSRDSLIGSRRFSVSPHLDMPISGNWLVSVTDHLRFALRLRASADVIPITPSANMMLPARGSCIEFRLVLRSP